MNVTVKLFARLREIAGVKEVKLEVNPGSTVKDVIEALNQKFGEEFKEYFEVYFEKERLYLVLNGVGLDRIKGLDTRVNDGDILAIIPPIGGG